MIRAFILFVFFATINLGACADSLLTKSIKTSYIPLGVSVGVSDVSCIKVRNSILVRLEELSISSKWANDQESTLAVGPFVSDPESESRHLRYRQTYYLNIDCVEELITTISGEVLLEGLGESGQWDKITESRIIKIEGMRFLQELGF